MADHEFARRDGFKGFVVEFRKANGRKKRELYAGITETKAKRIREKRVGEVRAGTYVDKREARKAAAAALGPTFADFADRFLADDASQRRSNYHAQRLLDTPT